MVLRIDTANSEGIKVELIEKGESTSSKEGRNKFGSQILLPLIKALLKEKNLSFSDLKNIQVCTGPGSYTGIKVGVSVANALAYSLQIPVNAKTTETDLRYT